MSTDQIAKRLAELCTKGEFESAQKELYANDAVSIEPHASPAFDKETKGLDAILEKGKKWDAMVEKLNSIHVSQPVVAENAFAMVMDMDVEMKGMGHQHMKELCVYEVKDGKIRSEEFFM